MAVPQLFFLVAGQAGRPVLAHGLQQPVGGPSALRGGDHQRLVDQTRPTYPWWRTRRRRRTRRGRLRRRSFPRRPTGGRRTAWPRRRAGRSSNPPPAAGNRADLPPGAARTAAETVDPAGGRSRPGSWPPCAPRPARWLTACRPGAGRSAAPPHGSRPRPQTMAARRRPDPQTAPPPRRPPATGPPAPPVRPGRCSGSRLVANTVNSGPAASRSPTSSATGRSRCSQLSMINSARHERIISSNSWRASRHRRRPSGPGWPASTPPARRDD